MSMTEDDLRRASELERVFTSRYPSEAPFNFSKTISKALELAILQMLQPASQLPGGQVQQALTGLPADTEVLQARHERKQEPGKSILQNSGKPKKFQNAKKII